MPSLNPAVSELLLALDLESLEQNLFRGATPEEGRTRIYGGQVVGQAMVAACRTVEQDRMMHSLHAYFMRPGDPCKPVVYAVERLRDGRSFSTRRVTAIQHGVAIYEMQCSFHLKEEGLEHQFEMPNVPWPDQLMNVADLVKQAGPAIPDFVQRYWARERPIEFRPTSVDRFLSGKADQPQQSIWFRLIDKLPADPQLHQCVLGYASDMTLLDTSLIIHGTSVFNPDLQCASLDHAMWFHRPVLIDEWLLYTQDSPSTHHARGLGRGLLYNLQGQLVASTVQEGLIRQKQGQ